MEIKNTYLKMIAELCSKESDIGLLDFICALLTESQKATNNI